MRERKFVKFRVNMYEDTKFKIIDTMNERDLIHYIWTRLVTLAGKVNLEGELFLSRNIPYTVETLAIEFNRDVMQVKLAIKVLMDLEMLELVEDKIYRVKNFAKHQNIKINEKIKNRDTINEEKKKEEIKESLMAIDSEDKDYKTSNKLIESETAENNEITDVDTNNNNENIDRNKVSTKNINNNVNADIVDRNTNTDVGIEKNTYKNNLPNGISGTPKKKKKNNYARGKSKNTNIFDDFNVIDDDTEIIEFHEGELKLGKGEKVIMSFDMG